jgi:hypothetical protein
MNDGVKFTRKLGQKGGSFAIVIPSQLIDYLDAKDGDTFIVSSAYGKYGKFLWIQKEGENEVDVKDEPATGVYKES